MFFTLNAAALRASSVDFLDLTPLLEAGGSSSRRGNIGSGRFRLEETDASEAESGGGAKAPRRLYDCFGLRDNLGGEVSFESPDGGLEVLTVGG